MLGNKPLVSVVIVNWNGLDDTKECLAHLKKQSYDNFETIVVDNGSNDGSVKYLKSVQGINLVQNPRNLGFTGGHIAGYQASQGDYILLLNNDAIMDSHYIENAVNRMTEDLSIGALGGRAYIWDDDNKLFDTTNEFYAYQVINPITAEGIFTRDDEGVPQEVNNVSGSCVMVRRSVTDEIGYLYDPFFAYYEESDLFARVKRAGFKVIYDPELAIWHANGKTSNRKAPTFALYMMMRNRFRFAVRNFDHWSLIRFLKFYLKMGIASIVKSVLPTEQKAMHQAYAKAFLYNLVFGWKPLVERTKLRRQLGKSNYNQHIVREQTAISIVCAIEKLSSAETIAQISKLLSPSDEILVITNQSEITDKLSSENNPGIRVCSNKGYFNTHSFNLGAVVSKNEWLIFLDESEINNTAKILAGTSEQLYAMKRFNKKLLVDSNADVEDYNSALTLPIGRLILSERTFFIEADGFDKDSTLEAAQRQLVAYASLANKIIATDLGSTPLRKFDGDAEDMRQILLNLLGRVRSDKTVPTYLDKLTTRYYRLAQLRNFLSWLFTFSIPARLKLGRLKNLFHGIVTLNRLEVATELKHMQNEFQTQRNGRPPVALKEHEHKRLAYLKEHPEETPVFIILRDRYQALKQLLKWLENQSFKKIIFIDNDSRFPPLVKFLGSTSHQVLELRRNMTQTAPWSAGIIKLLVSDDFYMVSDPDILPVSNEKGILKHFYDIHSKYPHHLKVGFGLKIDDLPDSYPLKKDVLKWESQFWEHPLEPDVYEAGVDTTLALYKPYTYSYIIHPSIRLGGKYVAKHLPWYNDPDELSDEEIFYRFRADHNVNTWNKDQLPERYKKELAKQRR